MIRPCEPLVRHAAVKMVKIYAGKWAAEAQMHTLDFRFSLTQTADGLLCCIDPPSRLSGLLALLTRFDWGYGADADLNGFPYRVALLRSSVPNEPILEVWSEPPVRGKGA